MERPLSSVVFEFESSKKLITSPSRPGADVVSLHATKSLRSLIVGMFLLVSSAVCQGCSPEGAESIKIQDPGGIRSKMGGGGAVKSKPLGKEAAKVKEEEEKAPSKHFQRG